MNKRFICFLISGTPISIETLAEELVQSSAEDLKNIAQLLEQGYGISVCKKEVATQDLQKLFEEAALRRSQAQAIVFKNVPNFPIPPELLRKPKNKPCFAPPNKGKLNSKPKGKFKK